VREARNQQPLWDAMADGTVDVIANDTPRIARGEDRNDI